jgi:hypothetical protein
MLGFFINEKKLVTNQLFLKDGKKTCINHVSTVLEALFPLLRDEGCTYNNQ